MNKVVLSLGSNCGEREKSVRQAIGWLSRVLGDARCSTIYETPEMYGKGAPYMNAVMIAESRYDYAELNCCLKQYELRCGRDEACRQRGDVPIDIDLVIWNNAVVRTIDYSARFFRIGYEELGI